METAAHVVTWSEDKLKWMEQQLKLADNGYWLQDVWNPESNPLKAITQVSAKSRQLALHFDKFESVSLKTEVKFTYYEKCRKGEWGYKTIHGGHPYNSISQLSIFFNQYSQLKSIVEKSFNEWAILFRTFLTEQGALRPRTKKTFLKTGEIRENAQDDAKIFTLCAIYQIVESVYDRREEWEKDIWYFANLGITPGRSDQRSLNFTTISQSWLREAAKKFCKYELVTKNLAPGTCITTTTAIKTFSRYLASHYPSITESQINRSLFEDYLAFLLKEYSNVNVRLGVISKLDTFFTSNLLHKWLDIPQRLIFPGDLPKQNKNTVESKVIADVVVEQLLQYASEMPDYQRRMLIILANGGMRICELISLRFDCLKSDGSGGYLLTYYQPKVKEPITKPIASIFHNSSEVIAVIREQQDYVRQKWSSQCPYLFPSPLSKPGHIKLVAYSTFANKLKQIACTHNISDENGKFWNFHPHQFRHTAGTKLANDDEVGLFGTKTYLGHASINMTLHYAKMDERKLQKRIEKFNANNQVINHTGDAVDVLNDERYKEYWKYITLGNLLMQQALTNGFCGLPATLSPCVNKHKCLTCIHFITTPDF